MINFEFLKKGLFGLSRAYRANTMTGHLGAAVVAGYFFSERHPQLDSKVHAGIENELSRIIQGEELAFNPRKDDDIAVPELFEPHSEEKPREDQIERIAQALSHNIDKTRQSGHNVIFAAIAIRALKDHPEYATPSIIEGISRLIRGFDDESPGNGYYGKTIGRIDGNKVSLNEDDDFPLYSDQQAMAEVVLDELIHKAAERRQGFGGLHHIINHAAALTELSQYGYKELGEMGLRAHQQHMRLWRSLPNVSNELGAEKPVEHDPRIPAFWDSLRVEKGRAKLTHRIKTLYGFFTLVRLIDDSTKAREAEDKLRYLM